MVDAEYEFEWDDDKDHINKWKHRVSFNTAAAIFKSPVVEMLDDREDYGEVRYIAIGQVETVIFRVVYTRRQENVVRIISAQKANRHEREAYYRSTFSE